VIPAGDAAEATRGLAAARALLALAGTRDAALELIHVGPGGFDLAQPGVPVSRAEGPLEETILEIARARQACVIVMPTRGHDGVGDALLG
jgi:nucleotide-binding universal stress UspA family protein